MLCFDLVIEDIVADVRPCTLEPFDENLAFSSVEVKRLDSFVTPALSPIEILSDLTPEGLGIVNGALVQFVVLLHAGYVGVGSDGGVWVEELVADMSLVHVL